MKRAITPIVVVLLACGVAATAARQMLRRQNPQSVPAKPASAPLAKESNTVNYQGVSFTYDPALASRVAAETVPLMEDGKPSDVVPEHPSFTLVGYPIIKSSRPSDPEIKVFSIAGFRSALHNESMELAKVTSPPMEDLGPAVDTEVRVLKQLVAAKPDSSAIGRFLAKARGHQGCSTEMPFLPMWEACMAFVGHVKYVNFKNGRGVFFLTQWDTETTQIANDGLEYAYQGISNDGEYWVYAEFSVIAPVLPNGDEPDVMAWNEKNYLLSHQSKTYQDYARPVIARLEALPANKFQPNLELLEQLIQSLAVKNK